MVRSTHNPDASEEASEDTMRISCQSIKRQPAFRVLVSGEFVYLDAGAFRRGDVELAGESASAPCTDCGQDIVECARPSGDYLVCRTCWHSYAAWPTEVV